MANINNLPLKTGNYVDSENQIENVVDLLKGGSQPTEEALFPDIHNTLNTQPAQSGNMVGSDGNIYNIVDLLKNLIEIKNNIIIKSNNIPTANKDNLGEIYIYAGETDETYTHGYIYECVEGSNTIASIYLEPHKLVFDEGNLVSFFESAGDSSHQVVSGRFKYLEGGDIWNINGLDKDNNIIFEDYQVYTQDLIDSGFVFIVPSTDIEDEEEIEYELIYREEKTYSWIRIDVQP